jgi:hypothetical protein
MSGSRPPPRRAPPAANGSRERDEGNPNPEEGKSKSRGREIQAGWKGNPNWRKEIQTQISSLYFTKSISYVDSQGISSVKRRGRRRSCWFALGRSWLPWSSFRFLRSSKQSEGLAPFFKIVDAWARVSVRPRGRLPDGREEGIPAPPEQKPRGPRIKTGRSIRRQARMRPLERRSNRFSSLGPSGGRQPFMPHDYLLNACLFSSIPLVRPREADCGRSPSGACDAPFVQR